MLETALENQLLSLFAVGSSNKSVQRYLHDLGDYRIDIKLSKNEYIAPDLLIEIFHTLKTGDKIVALDRYLTKDLITGFLVDQPLVVNQAVFEVAFVRNPPGLGVRSYVASQPWVDAALAVHLLDTLPWYIIYHDLKMLAQLGRSDTPEFKRKVANCKGRSTVIGKRMIKARLEKFVLNQPASCNAELLKTKVQETMGLSRMDSLTLINTVASKVGEQTPEYWRTLFALAGSWSDTYETLIQTTASIINSNK